MKATHIEIAGRRYAAGLWWHPVDKSGKQRALARDLAKEDSELNAMAVLTNPPQVGVAAIESVRGKKHLPKVSSLAGAVKNALEAVSKGGNISANLRMPLPGKPNQSWCLCVSDGVILPEGDFVGTEEECGRVFIQNEKENSGIEWTQRFEADSETEAYAFLEKLFAETVPKNIPKIQRIERPPYLLYTVLVLVVLLIAGYFGFKLYRDLKNQAYLQELRERANKHKKGPVRSNLDNWTPPDPYKLFPRVWNNEPASNAVLSQCYDAASKLTLSNSGWEIHQLRCKDSGMEVSYRITSYGSYLSLPTGARQQPDKAKLQFSFRDYPFKLPVRTPETDLEGVSKTIGTIYEIAKKYNAKVKVQLKKQATKAIKGPKGPVTVRAPYREGVFQISKIGLPACFMRSGFGLNAEILPGIVISSVDYDAKNHEWSIGGEYYAALQ